MKVKGSMLGTMSGSIGGMTASHNRGGQYFRQRVVPTNPNSDRQAATRSYFGTAVNLWLNMLTAMQRMGWSDWAANTPTTNTLGDVLVLTGQQAFVGNYTARMNAGLAAIYDAPVIYNNGEPVTAIHGINEAGGGVIGVDGANVSSIIEIAGTASGAGNVIVQIGRPINATVKYFKGPYQYAAALPVIDGGVDVEFSDPVAGLESDYPLMVGQVRPIRMRVAYDDGRISQAFECICTVIDDA